MQIITSDGRQLLDFVPTQRGGGSASGGAAVHAGGPVPGVRMLRARAATAGDPGGPVAGRGRLAAASASVALVAGGVGSGLGWLLGALG